jgi:hypothetical protein
LCVVGLLSGIGVVAATPVGASPAGGGGSFGHWPGHGGPWHSPQGWNPFPRPSVCSGTLADPGVLAGTYRSGVIVEGGCLVNAGAATVYGNLTITPGSALNATFALNDVSGSGTSSLTVYGDVNVQSGAVLGMGCEPNFSPCSDDPNAGTGGTLTGSNHVYGSINALGALGLIVHASTIGGSVTQLGGGGGVNCNVPTSGLFSLLQSPVFSDYEDNTVGGDLLIGGLQTCWLGGLRNDVRGSVVDAKNTFADPDADEVVSNTVHGTMACFANSPAVQFGDSFGTSNQVGGWALGECGFGAQQPNPAANEPPYGMPPYYPAGPLTGWVGVVPSGRRLSKPSGMDTRPVAVPGTSVSPYCQTMLSVVGSMTTTRSR